MRSIAKAVIIEDEILVANMLESCLGSLPGLCIVGTVHSGERGVQLCLEAKPDLVLLDIEMPEQNGLDVAKELRKKLPEARVIIVSSHCEPYAVHELSRLKIRGFVHKGDSLGELLEAVRNVLEGKTYYSESFKGVVRELRSQAESYQKILSSREIEILIGVAEGRADAEIATSLGITPNTVATHRRNIRLKLNAHNDRDLLNYARQCGLVPLTLGE